MTKNREFQSFLENLTQFIDEEVLEALRECYFFYGEDLDEMERVIIRLQIIIDKKREELEKP